MTRCYEMNSSLQQNIYSSTILIYYYIFQIIIKFAVFDECIVRFQQSSDFWILGDVFIEAYYTHFDTEVNDDDWFSFNFEFQICESLE